MNHSQVNESKTWYKLLWHFRHISIFHVKYIYISNPSFRWMTSCYSMEAATCAFEILRKGTERGKDIGCVQPSLCFGCIVWLAKHLGSGDSKRQLILSPKWTGLPTYARTIETGGAFVAGFSRVGWHAIDACMSMYCNCFMTSGTTFIDLKNN